MESDVKATSNTPQARTSSVVSRFLNSLKSSLKKTFNFSGRSSRVDFWTFCIAMILANVALLFISIILKNLIVRLFGYYEYDTVVKICDVLYCIVAFIINITFTISLISISVRRLHDLGLTGFWMWYLSPIGLPVVFMVYLLNLESSCNEVMERIAKVCTNWVAWLLLPSLWCIGAPIAMILLFLYQGKNEPNQFGPSPLALDE